MNGKEMLEAMSFVDERYIEEAEHPRRKSYWKPIAAAAACLAVILVGVRMMNINRVHYSLYEDTAEAALVMEEVRSSASKNAAAEMAEAVQLIELTVRVTGESDGLLEVLVTDPGNSEFVADTALKIALPDTRDTVSKNEGALLIIRCLPDGIMEDTIHAQEILPAQ